MELRDTSALVTGGASGIGAACARQLADRGARVVIADRDEEAGERTRKELDCVFMAVDITSSDDVTAAESNRKWRSYGRRRSRSTFGIGPQWLARGHRDRQSHRKRDLGRE